MVTPHVIEIPRPWMAPRFAVQSQQHAAATTQRDLVVASLLAESGLRNVYPPRQPRKV